MLHACLIICVCLSDIPQARRRREGQMSDDEQEQAPLDDGRTVAVGCGGAVDCLLRDCVQLRLLPAPPYTATRA